MRYPMRLDTVWRPVLALFGGTSGRAFVEVDGERVRFRFGWIFDATVPRGEITAVRRVHWPLLMGFGWRIGPLDRIGLIGSRSGVVELTLRSSQRVRFLGVPWRVRRIAVSALDPDAVVEALAF